MKKTYVKPEVCFESFQLSACIANTCHNTAHLPTAGMCGVDFGATRVFLQSIDDCATKIEDGEYGYCYHNPDDLQNLFGS